MVYITIGASDDPSVIIQVVVNFSISFLYGLLFIATIVLLYKTVRMKARDEEGHSAQKLFLFLTAIQTFVRAVFFTLVGLSPFFLSLQNLPTGMWFVMSTLPFDFFCSTFTMLLYIWAKIYHWTQGGSFHKRLVIGLNIGLYISQLAEYVLYFIEFDNLYITSVTKSELRDVISYLVMGSFSIFLSIGILIYGSRLIVMFRRLAELQEGVKTIWAVAGICTFCFFFRGCLLIIEYWIKLSWVFELVYFVPSEILPITLMLVVFGKNPTERKKSQNSSAYLGGTKYSLLINK